MKNQNLLYRNPLLYRATLPRVKELAARLQQSRGAALAAVLLVALPLFFLFLGGWSFLDPDEGRYGNIPHEMLARGDFITPMQNGIKFFDKPPLLYWLIAAAYSVFGAHEWSARLIPALAALAGVLAAYALGRRMFSRRAGLLAALILATSLMWLVMGRFVVTDMLVSSLVFLALTFWWLGHSETTESSETTEPLEPTGAANRRGTFFFIAFWIVLALAFLAKGPISIVLTGGCILCYALLCRQLPALSKMRWAIGVPLFLAIATPWFVLVALRNPEFNHFFWYDQHIGRFFGDTTGNDHVQGPGYYFKFLPVVFFPWSFFVPAALLAFWRHRHRFKLIGATTARERAIVYLLCGVAFTLLFFSVSSGKLLTYILPVAPLLALLLAAYFDWLYQQRQNWNRALAAGVGLLSLLLLAAGVAVVAILPAKLQAIGSDTPFTTIIGGAFIAWAIALLACSWRYRLNGLIAGATGGFAITAVTVLLALTAVVPHYTTRELVAYIQPGLDSSPDSEVLTMGYIHSIPFYSGHRVEVLGAPDELKFGVAQMTDTDRRKWIYEDADKLANLQQAMNDLHPIYCFIEKSKGNLQKRDALMKKIGRGAGIIKSNEGFVVFGNRAALAITPPVPDLR